MKRLIIIDTDWVDLKENIDVITIEDFDTIEFEEIDINKLIETLKKAKDDIEYMCNSTINLDVVDESIDELSFFINSLNED